LWPNHEVPQPAIRLLRITPIETARGAKRSFAFRQFKSGRPDYASHSSGNFQGGCIRAGAEQAAGKPLERGIFATAGAARVEAHTHFMDPIGTTKVVP
jgi:hypothetical protein